MSLENSFPNLASSGFQITSEWSLEYNCIAWAAGDNSRWWWPETGDFWPINESSPTIDTFAEAFATIGYESVADDLLEVGYEKVALFAKDGRVTHAARQLPTGEWTSKLGIDIKHELNGVAGEIYGVVVRLLKRPLRATA